MLGPSVRDVMIFGYETFPNTPREWPCVTVKWKTLTQSFPEIVNWLGFTMDRNDWHRKGTAFFFTHDHDALCFSMTWV
jgi:hypothetical protein